MVYIVTRTLSYDYEGGEMILLKAFSNEEEAWTFKDGAQKWIDESMPQFSSHRPSQRAPEDFLILWGWGSQKHRCQIPLSSAVR